MNLLSFKFSGKFILWVFIAVLLLNLIIRFRYLDYPLTAYEGDGMANFLVAYHIAHFNEHILVGPYNSGSMDVFKYSPFYYYSLAFFVAIFKEPLFLWAVNILLQLMILAGIFLFGEKAFGLGRGLVASFIFGFTPFVLDQSYFIWQPYVSEFFIYLALFLLYFSWIKKNFLLLLISAECMALAITSHTMAFAILPVYALLVLILLKSQVMKLTKLLILFLVPFLSGVFLHLPTVYAQNTQGSNGQIYEAVVKSPAQFLENLYRVLIDYVWIASYIPFKRGPEVLAIIFLFLISCLIYFRSRKVNFQNKITTFFISSLILQQLLFISFMYKFHSVYLLITIGLTALLFSELVLSLIQQRSGFVFRLLGILILAVVVFNLVSGIKTPLTNLKNKKALDLSIKTLKADIETTKREMKMRDNSFFQIRSFNPRSYKTDEGIKRLNFISDAIILAPLEIDTDMKFTKIINYSYRFEQTNQDLILYLVCYKSAYSEDDYIQTCKELIGKSDNNPKLIGQILESDPISIFKYLK